MIPGIDGERMVMLLDEHGIEVATGAACSAQSDSPSTVIRALGKTAEEANTVLRVSMGIGTSEESVTKLLEVLPEAVHRERSILS